MTERVLNNFRGARALILHAADPNREVLAQTLRRLGLLVMEVEPESEAAPAVDLTSCDVLFFDADQPLGGAFCETPLPQVPYIALVGLEAPSRLARVVRHRCCGYLLKPVRPTGIFTALFLAFNEFALRRREASERAALADRLRERRYVTKAILRRMAENGIDDDAAFLLLRRESMRRRLSIERLAREIIEDGDERRRPREPRKAQGL
jgi:two-component system, response regulator / RNA-binding antiterminator